jgi:copper oxidase (laccase) domain-containing protein
MRAFVATSTVADGSMFNRNDPNNQKVVENRRAFLAAHDITLKQSTRLKIAFDSDDFCRYGEVTDSNKSDGMYGDFDIPHDALVTTAPNHALFLPLADCVGATFYDPVHHVLGLAHLGRHSLEQQGGMKFVAYLKSHYSSDPKEIKVWLGPAPGKDVYPIWALDNKGMKEVTFEQLHAAGILDDNIIDNPAETDKDQNYFSYSEFLKGHRENDGDHAMVAIMRE